MSKKIFKWLMIIALTLPLMLSACQQATETAPVKTDEPAPVKTDEPAPVVTDEPAPASPLADIDPSGQTVAFWHVWGTGDAGEGLTALVEEFNATNEWGITIEAIDQGSYRDLEDAMDVAIQSGDTPDVLVGYTNALDTWYSVDILENVDTYVNDAVWGLAEAEKADFFPGAYASGINASGDRVGFPHGQSANVLFYNFTWAQEVGFDSAPSTYMELQDQACAAAAANAADDNPDNDGTGGLVLYTGASNVASWVYALGTDLRTADGTAYDFTKPEVQEVAEFLKSIWDEDCAFPTESFPNPEFATRKALFTMSSTAGYPYQVGAFEAEDAMSDDVWGFIPFPGRDTAAVDSFGQNSGIVQSTPEKSLAGWLFIRWFTSPEIMAKWIEASAYHPTRASAVDLLGDYSAANPLWAEGLSLLPLGRAEPGWASWGTVRRDVQDTFAAILQGDVADIPGLLADLNDAAADALAETQ